MAEQTPPHLVGPSEPSAQTARELLADGARRRAALLDGVDWRLVRAHGIGDAMVIFLLSALFVTVFARQDAREFGLVSFVLLPMLLWGAASRGRRERGGAVVHPAGWLRGRGVLVLLVPFLVACLLALAGRRLPGWVGFAVAVPLAMPMAASAWAAHLACRDAAPGQRIRDDRPWPAAVRRLTAGYSLALAALTLATAGDRHVLALAGFAAALAGLAGMLARGRGVSNVASQWDAGQFAGLAWSCGCLLVATLSRTFDAAPHLPLAVGLAVAGPVPMLVCVARHR